MAKNEITKNNSFPLILTGTDLVIIGASDADTNENNGKFDFRIVSVTPKPYELDFYLNQNPGTRTGTISFKGCLDHEVRGLIV